MNPQKCLIPIGILSFFIGQTQGCLQINITCHAIRIAGGFNFSYECPQRSEISVVQNMTTIAHGTEFFNFSNEVSKMDHRSVTGRHCIDLQIKCVFPVGGRVKEECVEYKIKEEMKNPDPNVPSDHRGPTTTMTPDSSEDHTIGVSVGVTIGIIGIIGGVYWCWKKKMRREQRAPTVSGFLKYIQTRFCLRDGTFRGKPGEGNRQGDGSQADDSDLQMNVVGRDENGDDVEGVLVDSTDSNVDGKTSQSLSRDRNLSYEAIQLSKNGDISAPDVNKASNRRDMHRNVRDDPGGVIQGKVWMGDGHNGSILGDRVPEDRDNEAEPLLLNRAAIQGSAGEVDLVNKLGFAPDQVSGSSPPDNDVESLTTQQEEHTCLDII